ncbi:MAG: DUF3857 domain-containing protein [Bryobacterales bacterium]|nr:DUF3857 domain-containing protein [Bryobacterales bacterium]
MRHVLLLVIAAASLVGAPKAPDWLTSLASSPAAKFDGKVGAHVLLREHRVTIDGQGKTFLRVRHATRILNNSGRTSASARMLYRKESGKVKELNAWLITPSGTVKEYGRKETIDVALAENDVYNEGRARVISANSEAIAGSLFAFEGESEETSIFTQREWSFQYDEPAQRSRFVLDLPQGWRAESRTYNHPPVEPKVSGSSFTWELENLPPIELEGSGPGIEGLAPRIAISYYPPAGAQADAVTFSTWPEVSAWLSALNDPQAAADAAITAKVKELTETAKSKQEKIEALGRFAQSIKYVSIQMGISRGGGYRPHMASEVLEKLYGDCKDKSNLLRTMLREAGIEAFPVAIFAGDPTYVRKDWPSPHQFNHAIVAIRVSESYQAPAVAEHPEIGRVLYFDPTDEYTPVGFLPAHEQGSFALLVHPTKGDLVSVPRAQPEANHLERTIKASLNGDGSLSAMLTEKCTGESAAANRRIQRGANEAEYRKVIERWIAHGVPGSRVEKIETADAAGEFQLDVELTAPSFGQIMNQRLWMFKPALVERRGLHGLREEKRTQPFLLDPDSYSESVEIALPKGFRVDEIPEPVKLESEHGVFEASWEHSNGALLFKRSFRTNGGAIEPERYAGLRKFLRTVESAAEAAVVLQKQ